MYSVGVDGLTPGRFEADYTMVTNPWKFARRWQIVFIFETWGPEVALYTWRVQTAWVDKVRRLCSGHLICSHNVLM